MLVVVAVDSKGGILAVRVGEGDVLGHVGVSSYVLVIRSEKMSEVKQGNSSEYAGRMTSTMHVDLHYIAYEVTGQGAFRCR